MGGYNSGRRGGRPTVEEALTLNIKLLRDGPFRPNQRRSSSILWTNSYTEERTGWVSYQADLGR